MLYICVRQGIKKSIDIIVKKHVVFLREESNMNKKKILVTGANGYLGQGVVKKLLDKGYFVIATDFKIDQIDERAKRIQINLFDVENPYVFFEKPDILLHLAWRDGFVHYSEKHLNDLPMHYKFIKAMMESDIELISVMGSMHEIGFWEGAINENTPCKPLSLYGMVKRILYCWKYGIWFFCIF